MDDDYLNWMCHDVDVDADGGSSDARNQILPVFEREKDHFGSFPGMGARFRILLVKFFFYGSGLNEALGALYIWAQDRVFTRTKTDTFPGKINKVLRLLFIAPWQDQFTSSL